MTWLVTIVILILVLLIVGSYYLFRDTMNRIQYIERIHLYWVTRDTDPGGPHIKKAWMRHTSPPYWRGEGVEFRAGKYTFQVGVLKEKVPSLEHQISNIPEFSPPVHEIREWVDEDA
jgi:hypothetical protein